MNTNSGPTHDPGGSPLPAALDDRTVPQVAPLRLTTALDKTGSRSRGIGRRLHGVLRPPGVQAALEGLGPEAELAKLQRRTGAGLLPWSGAVQHERLVAEAVGRPLGDLVGQNPDAAGDADAVALVL